MATQGPRATFVVLFGAAALLVVLVLVPLWQPLLLAAVLAGATARWQARATERLGGRRRLVAAGFTLALVLCILVPLAVFAVFVVREGIAATDFVRTALARGGLAGLTAALPERLEHWVQRLQGYLPSDLQSLSARAVLGGHWAAVTLVEALGAASDFAFHLAMMLIAYYFLLADGPQLVRWAQRNSTLEERQTRELLTAFREVSKALLGANVGTGAVQAIAAGIGYAVARVPNPVFFAFLTFVVSFIPSIGTSIVALPLAGLLLLTGRPWAALFLAAWAVIVVGLVDNLVRPLLLRGGADQHGALVFFAMIGGVLLVGPIGIVVGPLALTFFLTMVHFRQRDLAASADPGPPDVTGT